MRAIILSAAVLAVLACTGTAKAQVFGSPVTQQPPRVPGYANPYLSTRPALTWTQKMFSFIPDFRGSSIRQGQATTFANPETNPTGYLQGFGFRRIPR